MVNREPRVVYVNGQRFECSLFKICGDRLGAFYSANSDSSREPIGPWYRTEQEALDRYKDQIEEELAVDRHDEWNDFLAKTAAVAMDYYDEEEPIDA